MKMVKLQEEDKKTITNKKERPNIFVFLTMCLVLTFVALGLFWSYFGIGCHIKSYFDKDLYCIKDYKSNITNSDFEYVARSHKQDKLNEEVRAQRQKELDESNKKNKECFDKGKYYNKSFDIFNDYNLDCKKLAYINDHLIDKSRQVDGGYIDGSYHGLFSYGHIEGRMYDWVTEGILATGQLVKNISYHLDCENSTLSLPRDDFEHWTYQPQPPKTRDDTKVIEYYTESEFVMYYVTKCIE